MAKLIYDAPFDLKQYLVMDSYAEHDLSFTPSKMVAIRGSYEVTFSGAFETYSRDGETAARGALRSITVERDGHGVVEITGLDLDFRDFDTAGRLGGKVAAAAAVLAGGDTVVGSGGADGLLGCAGNDKIYGLWGEDTLTGGTGRDTLTGGKDADVFRFAHVRDSLAGAAARDVITDLTTIDTIDLKGVDANASRGGNQAFAYIGAEAYSHHAGELRFKDGMLSGDVNGDGVSDFQIEIRGTFHADHILL